MTIKEFVKKKEISLDKAKKDGSTYSRVNPLPLLQWLDFSYILANLSRMCYNLDIEYSEVLYENCSY